MGKDISKTSCTFQFCDGGSCRKAGSEQVIREARAYLKNAGAWDAVHTIKTRCNGRCEDAPTWILQPGNFWYKQLDPAKGLEIIKSHLLLNKPLEEHLLFQPGWESVKSDKERQKEAISFKPSTDALLGEMLLARMASSDQLLYPLFLYLFERYDQLEVQYPGSAPVSLKQAPTVTYTDTFDMTVISEELNICLATAPIPQDAPKELQERKVGVTEVMVLNPPNKAIRFKNRKGTVLLTIWLKEGAGQKEIWNHILKNYLNMPTTEPLISEYI